MRPAPWLALLAVPLLAACTGGAPPETETEPAPETGKDITITTEGFDVPEGDTFECFYTGVFAEEELSVTRILGEQAQGGHHITVYTTEKTTTGHAPCTDEEMLDWRLVGPAAVGEVTEPVYKLPEGLAYRVAAGKQIALQVHYINVTGAPYPATDTVKLHTVDASEVETYVNLFTMVDLNFKLPPNAATKSVTSATLKQDVQLLWIGGHMHGMGTRYTIDLTPESQASEVVYDQEWAYEYSSHPPTTNFTRDQPLVIKAGTKVRQTCAWNNTTPEEVKFPREMCATVGYYFPDQGKELILFGQPDAEP